MIIHETHSTDASFIIQEEDGGEVFALMSYSNYTSMGSSTNTVRMRLYPEDLHKLTESLNQLGVVS